MHLLCREPAARRRVAAHRLAVWKPPEYRKIRRYREPACRCIVKNSSSTPMQKMVIGVLGEMRGH
jgi:hypothetical protein